MATKIKAKKNMHNKGQCFTKGQIYIVNKHVYNNTDLIDCIATNDLGESHNIGMWYKNFEILNEQTWK